jgi:hypothetical protein
MLRVRETAPQILVYNPVHQQFEQFGKSRQYRNATIIRNVIAPATLEHGSNKQEFPSIEKDTRCLLNMLRGNANQEAQFFRISDGTPTKSWLLLLSNSNNVFSTSETVNQKVARRRHSQDLARVLDGTYSHTIAR